MKATSALRIYPFTQTIELMKPVPDGKAVYWKAQASQDALTVCLWCEDEPEHARTTQQIPCDDCVDKDPVQEMWRRAADKLEQLSYHFINGE